MHEYFFANYRLMVDDAIGSSDSMGYPIGGFVRLSQATCNKIHRLSSIEAYMNLICCDWGRHLETPVTKGIAVGLHSMEERYASTIPMWQLDCLPDEAAARLCYETIVNRDKEGVIEQ